MKTANIFRTSAFLAALLMLVLTSCQKSKNTVDPQMNTNSIQNLANDENKANMAADEALADINQVLANSGNLKSTANIPCNATVDSTSVINDTITYYVTYDGDNCKGTLHRTGKIEIRKHVGTHWYQKDATVIYKYINFRVTKIASQKTITLNGQKKFTNESGWLIFMIGQTVNGQLISSVTHKDEGYMNITFDDGTSKFWNVARKVTYTKVDGQFVLTFDGFGSADGYDNLVHWGLNRNGEQFYIQILQPIVHREACQFDPCAGQKKMSMPGDNKGATITFGYDSNNQPITGSACPEKYKVDWFKNGNSGTLYLFL